MKLYHIIYYGIICALILGCQSEPPAIEPAFYVVCEPTQTGIDPAQYAEDAGAICVDECPAGYDTYTTQTGIQECIEHYGREAIRSWAVCDRSDADCNCVKAYETTEGKPIEDPKYRCVPDRYANRLLFRAGIDLLDEVGEQSVMIA
ncbi:MAG: hypothetical protein ACQESG_08050 [Nanobdellota archaeon]